MNYYIETKEILINNEITKKVKDYSKNKSDLESYYKVGKILYDVGKHYDEGIIKEHSKQLTEVLNIINGFVMQKLQNQFQLMKILSKQKNGTILQIMKHIQYIQAHLQ